MFKLKFKIIFKHKSKLMFKYKSKLLNLKLNSKNSIFFIIRKVCQINKSMS